MGDGLGGWTCAACHVTWEAMVTHGAMIAHRAMVARRAIVTRSGVVTVLEIGYMLRSLPSTGHCQILFNVTNIILVGNS